MKATSETENFSRFVVNKGIKTVIKTFSTKKSLGLHDFIGKFY